MWLTRMFIQADAALIVLELKTVLSEVDHKETI